MPLRRFLLSIKKDDGKQGISFNQQLSASFCEASFSMRLHRVAEMKSRGGGRIYEWWWVKERVVKDIKM
jgi:hypothetical protein